MSERESFMFPDGRILYVPTDEEDAAIRAAIEADPDQREGNPRPLDPESNPMAYRMRKAALRNARERRAREAAAQANTEDE